MRSSRIGPHHRIEIRGPLQGEGGHTAEGHGRGAPGVVLGGHVVGDVAVRLLVLRHQRQRVLTDKREKRGKGVGAKLIKESVRVVKEFYGHPLSSTTAFGAWNGGEGPRGGRGGPGHRRRRRWTRTPRGSPRRGPRSTPTGPAWSRPGTPAACPPCRAPACSPLHRSHPNHIKCSESRAMCHLWDILSANS